MDDAKTWGLFLFVVIALLRPFAGDSEEFTYVSPERITQLEAQFDSSHFAATDAAKLLKVRAWRCDLFGVRTKLQVKRDIDLYQFASDASHDYLNHGAEPILKYQIKDDALEGQGTQGLVDRIRVTSSGDLIARLSQPARGVTLAYAVCHGALTPPPADRLIEARWSGYSSASASF